MRRSLFVLMLLAGCDEDPTQPPALVPVGAVDIPADTVSVILDDTLRLRAVVLSAGGDTLPGRPATWVSSDPGIASVTTGGLVLGIAAGAVTLTASIDGYRDSVVVVSRALSFTRLSAGYSHTCGLLIGGEIWCWGGNSSGELGIGGTITPSGPRQVVGGHAWRLVAAGEFSTCALTTQDQAWCWGANYYGQLGNGGTEAATVPTAVAGAPTFVAIGSPANHACALTAAGVPWCWGANYSAQLGDASHTDRPTAAPISSGVTFQSIAVSTRDNTCGLDAGGGSWCWGNNNFGQLGYDTSYVSLVPVPVSGGHVFGSLSAGSGRTCGVTSGETWCWGEKWFNHFLKRSLVPVREGPPALVSVSEGYTHACGLTAMGEAWCWGANFNGELGNGTIGAEMDYPPSPVVGGHVFSQIVAGIYGTCGLATDTVYCWGWATNLGNGTSGGRFSTPVPVSGNLVFTALADGDPGCALAVGGAAYCWGELVGDGTDSTRLVPTPVAGGLQFTALTRQTFSHTCGLTSAGEAYCWGRNSTGALGNGTDLESLSPTPVSGGQAFASLIAGGFGTCGLTSAGAAWCWGRNPSGQVGDGTTTDRWAPAAVSGALQFESIARGNLHTCGTSVGGAAYCWGSGSGGQLGNGMSTDSPIPLPTMGGLVFTQIAAGRLGTCGITGGGTTYCWPSINGDPAPQPVPGGVQLTQLSVGGAHACGLTAAGLAYCWGENNAGQLGTTLPNGAARFTTPVPVAGNLVFQSITSAEAHSCGVTNQGVAYCWGSNWSGQLGVPGSNGLDGVPYPVKVLGQ